MHIRKAVVFETLLILVVFSLSAPSLVWSEISKQDFEKAQVHVSAGNDFMVEHRYPEAIQAYQQVLDIVNDEAFIYYNLGIAYYEVNQNEEAIDHYRKAIAIKPKHAKAYANMGLALENLGRVEKALEAYKNSIRIDPESTTVRLKLAAFYESQGTWDEAIGEYRTALESDPEYAKAHYWLAKALFHKEKLPDAWRHLHLSQDLGYREVESEFVKSLTKKMPEPERVSPVKKRGQPLIVDEDFIKSYLKDKKNSKNPS